MSASEATAKANINNYMTKLKEVYDLFITYIDNPDSRANVDYNNLRDFIRDEGIDQNKEMFSHFIKLLVNVSNNHYRLPGFFDKIERILTYYQDTIQENNTNEEIYEQFEDSKRLLYFLIKEGILNFDETITQLIQTKFEANGKSYSDFFISDMPRDFIDAHNDETINYYLKNLEEYDEKRKIGENDSYICTLIRNDSVQDFISHINKKNISVSSIIEPSIFETNSFLNEKKPSLIEYAAFFGAAAIFQYLYRNIGKVDDSLYLYALHSNNSFFYENHIRSNNIKPKDMSYEEAFLECIKCHHNDFARFIQDNLINLYQIKSKRKENPISFEEIILNNAFKYQNYSFVPTEFDQDYAFFYFYQYDYHSIVNILKKVHKKNFEAKIINFIY